MPPPLATWKANSDMGVSVTRPKQAQPRSPLWRGVRKKMGAYGCHGYEGRRAPGTLQELLRVQLDVGSPVGGPAPQRPHPVQQLQCGRLQQRLLLQQSFLLWVPSARMPLAKAGGSLCPIFSSLLQLPG